MTTLVEQKATYPMKDLLATGYEWAEITVLIGSPHTYGADEYKKNMAHFTTEGHIREIVGEDGETSIWIGQACFGSSIQATVLENCGESGCKLQVYVGR